MGWLLFEAKDQYQTLRNDFVNIQDKVFEEYSLDSLEKQGYLLDLSFGIEMYQLLNSNMILAKEMLLMMKYGDSYN